MRLFLLSTFFLIFVCFHSLYAGQWCKAIYPYSENALDGEFQKQLSICRNSDNLFLSIHSGYKNAQHLLNASIANYCDLNKKIVISEPKQNSLFYSSVCVFKKHFLRVD